MFWACILPALVVNQIIPAFIVNRMIFIRGMLSCDTCDRAELTASFLRGLQVRPFREGVAQC